MPGVEVGKRTREPKPQSIGKRHWKPVKPTPDYPTRAGQLPTPPCPGQKQVLRKSVIAAFRIVSGPTFGYWGRERNRTTTVDSYTGSPPPGGGRPSGGHTKCANWESAARWFNPDGCFGREPSLLPPGPSFREGAAARGNLRTWGDRGQPCPWHTLRPRLVEDGNQQPWVYSPARFSVPPMA